MQREECVRRSRGTRDGGREGFPGVRTRLRLRMRLRPRLRARARMEMELELEQSDSGWASKNGERETKILYIGGRRMDLYLYLP